MTLKESPKKRKTEPKSELLDLEHKIKLQSPIIPPAISNKYKTVCEEDDDSPFVKLLEAINIRALDLPLQSQFPKMDLTALYCFGLTIQEYARHLSTNIMTQKLASENMPQLNTLFSKEELNSRKISSIINKYKPKKSIKSLTPAIDPRPDIHQETSAYARVKKYHRDDPFDVNTVNGDTYYQKMLRTPDWQSVLRKNRDPEAAAAAAKIRREKDVARLKKQLQDQKSIKQETHIPLPQIKKEYQPPTPPADIFDREFKSKTKKKTSASSSSSLKRKRPAHKSIF